MAHLQRVRGEGALSVRFWLKTGRHRRLPRVVDARRERIARLLWETCCTLLDEQARAVYGLPFSRDILAGLRAELGAIVERMPEANVARLSAASDDEQRAAARSMLEPHVRALRPKGGAA